MVDPMALPMAALMADWKVLLTDTPMDTHLADLTVVQLDSAKVGKMVGR